MFRVSAFKRLTSSDTSIGKLSHQLQQQCSVSRTAKGKGKVKAAQTLKRSKAAPKKGGDTGGGRKTGLAVELEEMAKKCLNAPTPIRFLKPKERAREAEREKLGLVSKERQREMDALKKQAKEGTGFEKPSTMGTPGLDLISLGLVDADAIPKYELTVEDGRRLAKEYSRVLMRRHRARQKAETTLLRLKKEAIEALPEPLKAAALVPDLAPFPPNRYMATLTPPIEGYIDKIREAAERSSVKEKLR
ncbi:Formimidoyltransferase-cyclodeaminase [Bienertia sinuspersici]